MSERDRRAYYATKQDPEKYAKYLERKRLESNRRQKDRAYETLRKRRWRTANPERNRLIKRAGEAIRRAIKTGRIAKPVNCESCNKNTPLEAHHHLGYQKENHLNVKWLCIRCHHSAHSSY